jgi:hypothetical protein
VRTAAARNYSVSGGVFIKKCLASKRFLQYGHGEDDPLVKLKSPFRFVIRPIVDYVLELEKTYPDRQVAVLLSELVENRWYYALLHNNRAEVLRALILSKSERRITVVNIPWYLSG